MIITIWLPVGLLATIVDKLAEEVWTVRLADCHLDYHTPIHAVALACLGVDFTKLWPMPVEQPWQETPDPLPDPWPGWCAGDEAPSDEAGFLMRHGVYWKPGSYVVN